MEEESSSKSEMLSLGSNQLPRDPPLPWLMLPLPEPRLESSVWMGSPIITLPTEGVLEPSVSMGAPFSSMFSGKLEVEIRVSIQCCSPSALSVAPDWPNIGALPFSAPGAGLMAVSAGLSSAGLREAFFNMFLNSMVEVADTGEPRATALSMAGAGARMKGPDAAPCGEGDGRDGVEHSESENAFCSGPARDMSEKVGCKMMLLDSERKNGLF